MVNCPDCNKEFKETNFWFENHLILKHNRWKLSIKTIFLDLIFVGLIPFIFFIISQNNQDNLSEKLDMIINQYNITITEECISNITTYNFESEGIVLESELYDGCDVKIMQFNNTNIGNYGSYSVLVYPFWNASEKRINYFLDGYYGNTQINRFSLFKGDGGYLIFQIYTSDGKSYLNSIDVNNWKEKEWAWIIYSFDGNSGNLVLGFKNLKTGYNKVEDISVEPFNFSIKQVTQYAGSDIYGNNQANSVISKIPRCWIFLDEVDENCPDNFLDKLK